MIILCSIILTLQFIWHDPGLVLSMHRIIHNFQEIYDQMKSEEWIKTVSSHNDHTKYIRKTTPILSNN